MWRSPRQGSWIRAPFWSMGLLGPSWRPPGGVPGPPSPYGASRGLPNSSGALLVPSWALLGASLGISWPPGGFLGPPGASRAALGPSWERSGSLLGPPGRLWGPPGGLLGASWDFLGASWAPLEAAWGPPGACDAIWGLGRLLNPRPAGRKYTLLRRILMVPKGKPFSRKRAKV